jgi:hypothetical protein
MRQFTAARGPRSRLVSAGYIGQAVDVVVQPLDALLEDQPTTMWKIDVEGSELEVLKGARRAIASPALQAVVMEAHNVEIEQFMRSCGFETAQYQPFARELSQSRDSKSSKNHLWLRDVNAVELRCQQGPIYDILSTRV